MAHETTQVGPESGETGTKGVNPRVEIDTSQPFESVKEAVTRFGGSGSWIPLHILRLAGHDVAEMDMETVEKQAKQLEKELIIKEQETLEVLRELESAKSAMEGLKVNLMKESSSILNLNPESGATTPVDKSTATMTLCPIPLPPAVILTELKEAKSNLNKTTNDLAMIRASVESLHKKMRTHKANLEEKEEETKHMVEESIDVSNGPQKLTFEAQQFRKMEEAAQYEVIKATSEIEHTKISIRMVEMRLIAAKKMEEAARAMEAVARAENNDDNKSLVREGITLSYEEYSALAEKAQKADEGFKKNGYYRKDANLSTMAFLKNAMDQTDTLKCSRRTLEEALEATNGRNLESRNEFFRGRSANHPKPRNPYPFRTPRSYAPLIGDDSNLINKESRPVLRSSVSIGDILSRKLILQDDIVVRDDVERQTQRDETSLNQMLREQSGLIFHDSGKADKEGRIDKQFFTQRKKFGFIHISLPLTKHKKKSSPQTPEPLNMRFP
uniref:WEB family protein At2g40480-like isoform X2 n=1 Tax=Erigeron canadensis TaxID=72917 RepID=UPI001CB9728F|nr:WEB family protein At2g40480-like isoform X2 [Erigeron canadensis]